MVWIDGFIGRNREVVTEEYRYGWAIAFGYIIGETLIRECDGAWEYSEEQDEWLVNLGIGKANPINKTFKYLTNRADSVASFFRVMKLIVEKGGTDKLRGSQSEDMK